MAEIFSPRHLSTSAAGLSSLAQLDQAWADRLEDAKVLAAQNRAAAAISNGLYALEIRLKVSICRKLDLAALPRAFEFHDLEGLLTLAGLNRTMQSEKKQRSRISQSWDELKAWSDSLNELRYRPESNYKLKDARRFLDLLENPSHGVFPWLSRH